MARSLRIEYEGAFHHVMNKGYLGMNIFLDHNDHYFFLECLENVFKSHTLVIHAFCIMTNHFHLFTETPNANLAKAMQKLQSKYASYFKNKYNHSGKVFWKRYKSILVDNSTYGVDLVRYIHRNPLGTIVRDLNEYKFSSYKAYLGMVNCPIFLDTNLILDRFDNDRGKARRKFHEHTFLDGASYWLPEDFITGKSIMGKENFIDRIKKYLPDDINEELVGLISLRKSEKVESIKKYIAKVPVDLRLQKNLLIYALRKKTHLQTKEIKALIGEHSLSKSSIANRIKRLKGRACLDHFLAKTLIEIDCRL